MTQSNLATQPLEAMGGLLFNAYTDFAASAPVEYADIATRYYEQENDIEQSRILYENSEGNLVEDHNATNTRISHGFFPELVDQKVQYILGDDGIEAHSANDDDKLDELLAPYFTDDWQLTMQELIEGASIKGFEGIFARTTADGSLRFQVADALKLVPVFDDFGTLVRVLRYYTESRYSTEKKKSVKVEHCDVWSEEGVAYYIQMSEGDTTAFKLDPAVEINPADHITATMENPDYDEDTMDEGDRWLPLGRNYSRFPFHILQNNRRGTSDLKPIKGLIDDYDIMNCFLSNNLQDMSEAFYVIHGAESEPLDRLMKNIKSRKGIKVRDVDGAGVDMKTYQIPTEGRKVKMELDEVNIYRSGMGFNSQQLGDGNITNVIIKSRYTLLSMKASKLIARLKACLKWQAELVVDDINLANGTSYTADDIVFDIEPKAIVNESDIIKDEYTEAQTEQLKAQTILQLAPRIGDDETLRLICEQFDLDFDEIQKDLEEEAAPEGGVVTDPTAFLPQNNEQSAAKAAATQQQQGQPTPPPPAAVDPATGLPYPPA